MRKTLLLTIALLLSIATFAQDRAIIIRETFDSTTMPSGWSTTDNSTDNWGISETNKAGGEANELKLSPNPQAVGIIRVITKSVDLTGLDKVTVSFRHYFQKKSMSTVIGIATSSNNGTTWSSAWTKTYIPSLPVRGRIYQRNRFGNELKTVHSELVLNFEKMNLQYPLT